MISFSPEGVGGSAGNRARLIRARRFAMRHRFCPIRLRADVKLRKEVFAREDREMTFFLCAVSACITLVICIHVFFALIERVSHYVQRRAEVCHSVSPSVRIDYPGTLCAVVLWSECCACEPLAGSDESSGADTNVVVKQARTSSRLVFYPQGI